MESHNSNKFAQFLDAQRKEIKKYLSKHFGEKPRSELVKEWVALYAKKFREKYYKRSLIKIMLNYIKLLYKKLFDMFNI